MRTNSSQALAIDVFGTIQFLEQIERDAILASLANDLGLPTDGPWQIELEWTDATNALQETGTKSQIDAVATSPHTLMFFECKFTEADGGCCSQPNPIATGPNKGKKQCNGNYVQQINPVTKHEGKCALTGKGIRYWEIAPHVLQVDRTLEYLPCPFAGPAYQWMRNLSLCWLKASEKHKQPGFLVVYADAAHLPMAQKVRTEAWEVLTRSIRQDQIRFGTYSYQQILQQASLSTSTADKSIWTNLQNWVDRKIAFTRNPQRRTLAE